MLSQEKIDEIEAFLEKYKDGGLQHYEEILDGFKLPFSIYVRRNGLTDAYTKWLWENHRTVSDLSGVRKLHAFLKAHDMLTEAMVYARHNVDEAERLIGNVTLTHLSNPWTIETVAIKSTIASVINQQWGLVVEGLEFKLDVEKSEPNSLVWKMFSNGEFVAYSDRPVFINSLF